MWALTAFASGLFFGLGLILAGMSNPAKVLGFLDVFGLWDPSLALVMGGAIAVGLLAFTFAGRMQRSLLGLDIALPLDTQMDARLLIGSAVFGVGWGWAGFCPGPAVVALGAGEAKALVFAAAMLAGMALYEWLGVREQRPVARDSNDTGRRERK